LGVLAGSVLVDVEPGVVMVFGLDARLHGPLHTFAAAIALGFLAGLFGGWAGARLMGWSPGWRVSGVGGVVGWGLHVWLDSFLYTDITPFQPLSRANPFLGLFGGYTVVVVYVVSGLLTLWGVWWLLRAYRVGVLGTG